jgi:hypothetical protein
MPHGCYATWEPLFGASNFKCKIQVKYVKSGRGCSAGSPGPEAHAGEFEEGFGKVKGN